MKSSSSTLSRFAVAGLVMAAGMTAASASQRGPVQAMAIDIDRAQSADVMAVFSPDESGRVGGAQVAPADRNGRFLYIIRFDEPSLARYEGGIQGLAPTSPRATGQRINTRSDAARAYTQFLEGRQANYLESMAQYVKRDLRPAHQFLNVLNGMTLRLTPEEAKIVSGLPFVAGIEIDRLDELLTDEGPTLIRAPEVWAGMTNSGLENRGEGIVIGIIDSGFNHGHPSFTEVASDGYVHINPYGDGVFTGLCADPGAPDFEDVCNNKVIGTYNLHPDSSSSDDTAASGHGTHVGSTAGGNPLTISFPFQYLSLDDVDISGVAPRANLINYKVCEPTCPVSSRVDAVNFAIADGVHVLNHSIGNAEPPWASAVSLAFLDANAAGIVTAASAGNSGPGPATAASTGPWNLAVGASTHQRRLALFANIDNDPTEFPGTAWGIPLAGPYSGTLRYAGDVDAANFLGCDPFPANAFDGEAALIRRGVCAFAVKVDNAVAAGADFVVIANNEPGIQGLGGLEAATVSVLSVSQATGDAFISVLDGGTAPLDVQAIIDIDPSNADSMAGFSSRGPSSHNTITPAITAPGAQILAGSLDANGQFVAISGTSMSSPHVAGAAALLMAERPAWSPTEIRSALTLAANPDHRKEDGVTPADPFDMGSGRLDVAAAANIGFVMDETIANFVAANPLEGGDPSELNLSSIKHRNCAGSCSFERTIRSVVDQAIDYTVSADVPAGASITVTPSSFTLAAGQSLTLDIEVDVSGADVDEWLFAAINITQQAGLLGNGPILSEDFSGEDFPPAGWSRFDLDGAGTQWVRTTASSNSVPASAFHQWSTAVPAPGQNGWLVSPTVTLGDAPVLNFAERTQFPDDYRYQGVWVSTDSCDPADGDFAELVEVDDGSNAWRSVSYSMQDYAEETVCVAFRYGGFDGSSWYIDDIEIVNASEPFSVSAARMPVAVVPREPVPRISIAPAGLSATQQTGEMTERSFSITNEGQLILEWSLSELAPRGNGGVFSDVVIWDNPRVGSSGRINNFSIPADTGIYQSDAFAILAPSSIATIVSEGFLLGAPGVTDLVWYVFPDDNGVPAGDPETSPEAAIWSFTAAPTSPGVSFINATMSLDLAAAGAPALDLDAGVYWLLAYPTVQTYSLGPNILYAWYHGASAGTGRQIGPGGLSGFPTDWVGAPEGRAFTLTGSVDCTADDNPWISSVTPTSGALAAGESDTVNVEFDADGLPEGTYNSAFCVTSNDPDAPVTLMPVVLNVVNLPAADISSGSETLELEFGESGSQQVVITNSGLGELSFNVVGGSQRSAARGTSELIYDQTATQTTSGALAIYDLDGTATWAVQAAEDFIVPAGETWTIDRVVAPGFYLALVNTATDVRVYFYADDDGKPGDEVAAFLALAPSNDDAGVLTLDLPESVVLGGGTYWLSVQPVMHWSNDGRWFWYMNSGPVGNEFHWRNPGNGYGSGCTDWAPGTTCGFGNPTVSFQLFGRADDACEPISAVPWLSVDPESGTVAPEGGEQAIDLIADASQALPGVYSTTVCFETNDGANPLLAVDVTLTVTGTAPDAIFSDRFEESVED